MANAKPSSAAKPIVFTLLGCPSCERLKSDWTREGIAFDERDVKRDRSTMNEALKYGHSVPVVLFPDGRVEVGYKNMIG